MSCAAPVVQIPIRQHFAAFAADRREPDAIARLRREGFDRFASLGCRPASRKPGASTDLSALAADRLAAAGRCAGRCRSLADAGPARAPADLRQWPFRAGFVAVAGIAGSSLYRQPGQALLTHPERIEPHLDRLPGLEQHPFAALNTAFWEDGAFMYLPRQRWWKRPIHLIFHATGGDIAVYPRLLLVLEDGAQATVVVEYRGKGRYLNAPVAELQLGAGAVLHYPPGSGRVVASLSSRRRSGPPRIATVRRICICCRSAANWRAPIWTRCWTAKAPVALLNGLILAHDRQMGDYHVRVEHAQPHGSSQQLFKSVLDGQGAFGVRRHDPRPPARPEDRRPPEQPQPVAVQAGRRPIPTRAWKFWPTTSSAAMVPPPAF
jgi:Fe-S cluster assembly protein SufD